MTHEMPDGIAVIELGIVALYVVIGAQFANEARKASSGSRKLGMSAMMLIFLLCAFTRVVEFSVFVSAIGHTALAIACAVFILTNQAREIMRD